MASQAAIPTSIKLDEATKKKIERLAEARHRKPHYLLVEAVQQYVEREEKREKFKQDAIAAWTEYKETGMYASGDAVLDWLETWGSPDEKAVPECHK